MKNVPCHISHKWCCSLQAITSQLPQQQAKRTQGRNRMPTVQQSDPVVTFLLTVHLWGCRMEKSRILTLESLDAHQRNNLINPDSCILLYIEKGLPWWLSGRESTCQGRRHRRHEFNPCVGKITWMRKWQPTPVL